MSYTEQYLGEVVQIVEQLDHGQIDEMVRLFVATRERGGRLFILGVGGSAGNDFRKIAGIESYAPTDNVSELTASYSRLAAIGRPMSASISSTYWNIPKRWGRAFAVSLGAMAVLQPRWPMPAPLCRRLALIRSRH